MTDRRSPPPAMLRRHRPFALALIGAVLLPVYADAQAGVIAKWSYIPASIEMETVGEGPADPVRLQWTCGAAKPATALPVGTPIVRVQSVNGETIEVPSTITAGDGRLTRGDTAVQLSLDTFRGTLSIDKKVASRLRVNPYLWRDVPRELQCDAIPGSNDTRSHAERLRDIEFFFELKNRQTIAFSTITIGVSGVAVPLRFRRAYTARNGSVVAGEVADAISLGALLGATYSRTRFQFVRNADNPLTESSRWTVALFSTLGKGKVDSTSSRSADRPAVVASTFPTLSVGPALMVNVRGIDLGLFTAPEFALGNADSRKWDFHRRWWWGLGLAYVPGK